MTQIFIQPTEAELEFLRLKREQDELQKQQDALKEQLERDKETREQQICLQKKIESHEQANARMNEYYKTLCANGCSNYCKLEEETITLKSSDYSKYAIAQEATRYLIKVGNIHIYTVTKDNKADAMSITGSFREYLATGLAKKILEKVAQDKQKKDTENKLEQAKRDLIIYFSETSPEGTKITERKEYVSYGNGYNRRSSGGYYINLIKLEYPNGCWVEIKYYETGEWNIYKKFDNHVPKFDTKEEWLEYLKN